MDNEILAVIENDSLRMGCLHLGSKVYGAVTAGCIGDVIERRLKRVGRLTHCCLLSPRVIVSWRSFGMDGYPVSARPSSSADIIIHPQSSSPLEGPPPTGQL